MGKHSRQSDTGTVRRVAAVIAAGGAASFVAPGIAQAATESDWDRIAECESSGLWNRPDGDGGRSSGGLQFQPASWDSALEYLRSKGVDTSAYPQGPGHQAYKATKRQQIIAGEALLALQGPGAWTCNAKTGFPLATGESMFTGGPNPFAGTAPAPDPVVTPPKPKYETRLTERGKRRAAEAKARKQASRKAVAPRRDHVSGTYVVKPGDWLTKIAQRHMGHADKWRALYDANRSVVGADPNLIHPGQKLKIPGPAVAIPRQRPAPAPTAPASSAAFVTPVDAAITQAFGNPRSSYTLGYHTGIDITAPQGTPVKAATAGVVVASDTSSAYGINVQIRHADGKHTLSAHLSGKTVNVGDAVKAGDLVGYVGSTGNSSGPHLHFEVRLAPRFAAGNFLDPAAWLRANGVSL